MRYTRKTRKRKSRKGGSQDETSKSDAIEMIHLFDNLNSENVSKLLSIKDKYKDKSKLVTAIENALIDEDKKKI